MGIANFLAEVLGIIFLIIPFSLFINSRQIKHIFSAMEQEYTVYIHGLVLLTLGVFIVLLHNVWMRNWVVLVTIVGWLFILKGLFLLFFTKDAVDLAKKMREAKTIPYVLLMLLFLGLVLLYFGFIGK